MIKTMINSKFLTIRTKNIIQKVLYAFACVTIDFIEFLWRVSAKPVCDQVWEALVEAAAYGCRGI